MEKNEDFHLTVNIVTWNSEEYIEDLLVSLEEQTFKGFQTIIIDNASKDGTLQKVSKFKNIAVIKNSSNLGFCKAHNKGIEMSLKFWQNKDLNDRFILICNPDIIFEKDCLEKLLLSFYNKKDAALMAPKTLRMIDEEVDNLSKKSKSSVIDTLGIGLKKSLESYDIDAGKEDEGADGLKEVFGLSGSLMTIRASILKDIKMDKEYFDEDFFAYKEDVDISWRCQKLGYKAYVEPMAVAYHFRKMKGDVNLGFWGEIKRQRAKPAFLKFLSTRNQIWLIVKNGSRSVILKNLPFILFAGLKKIVFDIIFDRKNLKGHLAGYLGIGKMLKKRKYLKNLKIVNKL